MNKHASTFPIRSSTIFIDLPTLHVSTDLLTRTGHLCRELINPGTIGQFTNAGTPIRTLVTGSSFQPYAITFGPDGLLYATDGHHPYIDRFDPSTGLLVGTVGSTGASQLATGPDGYLYVNNDDTIYKINTATNTQQALFALGFSGGGMTFRPDNGDLLVANTGPGGNRGHDIREFSLKTNQQVGVFATGYNTPFGLTFGPDGRLYTAEYDNYDDIKVVGATGGASTLFASGGSNLSSVAFDNGGSLFVTSYGTGQVLKFNGTTGALISSFSSGVNSLSLAIKPSAVPEPGAFAALLSTVSVGGMFLLRRRNRK